MSVLDRLDMTIKINRKEEEERLSAAQSRLLYLRLMLGGIFDGSGKLGPPVCLVFEGWDASGKGGAIKRVMSNLDPRHVRVASFAAPTEDEKRHHFLSRFWSQLPGWGGMAMLDRSWYGRVLVERVEEFCPEDAWRRAYEEIREFERTLSNEGMVMLKFWMHVTDEEQLRRFKDRQNNPLKRWKLTDEDWRNREKRAAYEDAVVEMLERTDTSYSPWILVEANDKRYARVKVIETINEYIERALAANGIEIPPETPGS
jgi:AMP-polyphosphate phosphotransferase